MKFLGPYTGMILGLRDMGLSAHKIAEELKSRFENDGLKGLDQDHVNEFLDKLDRRMMAHAAEGADQPRWGYRHATPALLKALSEHEHPELKRMEWVVFQEFQELSDAAIERSLGWELGAIEEYRAEFQELYRATKIRHIQRIKEVYVLEVFKTHQLLASLSGPALHALKSIIDDPEAPAAVRRQAARDILSFTAAKSAPKAVEAEGLVHLGPEFGEAALAAEKALRKKRHKSKDSAN